MPTVNLNSGGKDVCIFYDVYGSHENKVPLFDIALGLLLAPKHLASWRAGIRRDQAFVASCTVNEKTEACHIDMSRPVKLHLAVMTFHV